MKQVSFKNEVVNRCFSGDGVFIVNTVEEKRVHEEVVNLLPELTTEEDKGKYRLATWSVSQGWDDPENPDGNNEKDEDGAPVDHASLFAKFFSVPDYVLLLVYDYHPYLELPQSWRWIRDAAYVCSATEKKIIFISPDFDIPKDIRDSVRIVEWKMPDEEDIKKAITHVFESAGESVDSKYHTRLIPACKGMTNSAMVAALSYAWSQTQDLNSYESVQYVLREKAADIKKAGLLQYEEPEDGADVVGGMKGLKEWAIITKKALDNLGKVAGWKKFAKPPKAMLLTGPPGTGKSLVSKVLAYIFQIPYLSLDMSKTERGIVGEGNAYLRDVFEQANAMAPCILRVDEAEKGFAGSQDARQNNDGGAKTSQLAQWLTFMQEQNKGVIVVFTTNDGQALPAPILRRCGDSQFYIPLPTPEAREEIFNIHMQKRELDSANHDMDKLVKLTDSFSGAEIEGILEEGIRYAVHKDADTFEDEHLLRVINSANPLAKTSMVEVKRNMDWAEKNCWNAEKMKYDEVATEKGDKKRKIKARRNTGLSVLDEE